MKSINANGQQHALAALTRSVSIGLMFLVSPATALAAYDVNIAAPASPISAQIYGLHMYILYVCAAIFVVVFALMFYSIFKFPREHVN
jgi:cytochrome c oxidase subunit 2